MKAQIVKTGEEEPDAELKKAMKSKDRFVDHQFRADKKSIGEKMRLEHLEWKRLGDFGRERQIFYSG